MISFYGLFGMFGPRASVKGLYYALSERYRDGINHILLERNRNAPALVGLDIMDMENVPSTEKSIRWVEVGSIFQIYPDGKRIIIFPRLPGQLKPGMTIYSGINKEIEIVVKTPSFTRVDCRVKNGRLAKDDVVYMKVEH
jgi:hypothetical protein